ncbi:MAG: macrolide ABC transporter ATP-binding protein/permease [Clostridiales bacterium]|nr:macrolide ABC transporter ATP-binding protein/permease [Clostridiales bacterium]
MLLKLENIKKTYGTDTGVTFRALKDVSLTFGDKGLVFIVGRSGSGKSTLLNIIGGLDKPDSGNILVGDVNVAQMTGKEVDAYRNTVIGFVFQDFNLVTSMNVYDNVKLALELQSKADEGKVDKAIAAVGMQDKAHSRVLNLSGGQKQRVAIARALVKEPQIILADEPTGALDSKTGEEVMGIFRTLAEEKLVVVVTHDMEKAITYGDRIIEMRDGNVYRDVERGDDNGEKPEQEKSAFVLPNLIKLEKGEKLGESELAQINETLYENGKSFVFVESDPLKVQALIPQAGESVRDDKVTAGFAPYVEKETENKHIDFINSRLPVSSKIKLGLSNLNLKKVKMILTVILSVFTFILFAVAMSFNFYDLPYAVAQTVDKGGDNTIAIMRDGGGGSLGKISDAQVDSFKKKNPNIAFYEQYSLGMSVTYTIYNGFTGFDGVYEVDSIKDFGYPVIAGSDAPQNYNTVIMSQYAATKLLENGAVSASGITDMVGRNVTLNNENFTIGGIFASPVSYSEAESVKYETDERIYLDKLFVKRGFVNDYLGRIAQFDSGFSVYISYTATTQSGYYGARQNVGFAVGKQEYYDADDFYISTSDIDGGAAEIKRTTDVIIADNVLKNGFGIYQRSNEYTTVNDLNEDLTRELTLYYNGLPVYVSRDFTVKGVMRGAGFGANGIMLSADLLDSIFENVVYTKMLVAINNGNYGDTETLINSVYDGGFSLQAEYVGQYNDVLAFLSTFKAVILAISIVMSLVILMLLYSFIASSITLTRKNIGILRALGAKKADTFTIYALEGFAVTLISIILSVVILLIAGPVVNAILGGFYGTYLAVLNIKWFVYLITAALAIGVTVFSIVLPIRKYNNISPIEAINAKV